MFCRTCLTNQTLYVNLLSNYLPSEDDPNYESLLAQLPQYKASLDARYPLVCPNCSGNVEDQIKTSERLGRSLALGSWLREARPSAPIPCSPDRRVSIQSREAWAWRFRGCLWASTLTLSVVCAVIGSSFDLTTYEPPCFKLTYYLRLTETCTRICTRFPISSCIYFHLPVVDILGSPMD